MNVWADRRTKTVFAHAIHPHPRTLSVGAMCGKNAGARPWKILWTIESTLSWHFELSSLPINPKGLVQ